MITLDTALKMLMRRKPTILDVTDFSARLRRTNDFSAGDKTGTAVDNIINGRLAISFDEDSYAYVSKNVTAGTAVTMMSWVRNSADGCLLALSQYGGYGNRLYALYNNEGKLRVRDNTSSYPVSSDSGVFSSNTWHHVAFTYAGSGTKLCNIYLDGQRVGYGEVRTLTYSFTRYYVNSYGGAASYAGGRAGHYSDIRLYGRELSADEVNQVYLATR